MVSQKIAPTWSGRFLFHFYMQSKSRIITITALVSAIGLALIHNAALRFSWYYYYPAIDIPIHAIGGFAVGLLVYMILVSGLQKRAKKRMSQLRLLYVVAFGTLIVSVVWELLELVFYLTNDAGLSRETLSDILFGGVGAVFAWIFIQLLPSNR